MFPEHWLLQEKQTQKTFQCRSIVVVFLFFFDILRHIRIRESADNPVTVHALELFGFEEVEQPLTCPGFYGFFKSVSGSRRRVFGQGCVGETDAVENPCLPCLRVVAFCSFNVSFRVSCGLYLPLHFVRRVDGSRVLGTPRCIVCSFGGTAVSSDGPLELP